MHLSGRYAHDKRRIDLQLWGVLCLDKPREALLRTELLSSLDENVSRFRALLSDSVNADAQFRFIFCSGARLCVVYIEGMADDKKINDFILRACVRHQAAPGTRIDASYLLGNVLEIAQCEREQRVFRILASLVTGMTAILIDGSEEAILLETRGYPARQVNRTTNESVVIGAQEGFVESLRTNMTLMRRYVPSPNLITERISVGSVVPIQMVLVYLRDVADEAVVDAVRRRLKGVDARTVQGLGAIQQHIEDQPWALLPQMLQTERPDRAASCVMDGQVAMLAENSPYALIAPITLFHQLHASDDSFSRWQYGTFLRLIRIVGMLISVLLPGLYIALTDYHMHLLPLSLLGSIAEARANVPFPIVIEILIMEFSFYLINEAGTRIPQQIGSALGIVGALILGQAAVSASIISPILIIIVAITGLGNYAIPDYGFGIGLVICRLFVIACGASFGLYGFCLAAFVLSVSLCGMKSFGFPYMAPVAPARPHNPDLLVRLPIWLQRKAMYFAARRRHVENQKG